MRRLIGYLQLMRDKLRRNVGVFLFDKKNKDFVNKGVRHVVVMRADAKLGDSFISSFFFREIKKIQGVKVTVVTSEQLQSLYKDSFGVDRVVVSEKRSSYSELKRVAKEVGSADLFIHLTERFKLKDMYFLHLLKPRNVASLDDDIGYVNLKMKCKTKGVRFSSKYKYILEVLGLEDIDDSYIIPYCSEIENLNCLNYILLNPYGSNKNKTLSKVKIVELLKYLSSKYNDKSIFLLYSPNTMADAALSVKSVSCDNVSLYPGVTDIYDAIQAVSHADLVISVDTSIVHIADGLNKKLVSIYPQYEDLLFNEWIPRDSSNVSVVYSASYTTDPDMNNFSNEQIDNAINAVYH